MSGMIGDRLKEQRMLLKLTQDGVAKLCGVSKATISLWEKGSTAPKGQNLHSVAKALRVSPDYILTGKNSPKNNTDVLAPQYPMLEKTQLAAALASGNLDDYPSAELSLAQAALGFRAPPGSIIYTETTTGMAPMVSPGDVVIIDPAERNCTPGQSVWLFEVNGEVTLARVTETIRGRMLQFANQSPGWESIPLSDAICIGKVVGIVMSWLLP